MDIDGKKYSFAEIAGLPQEQQDVVIGKMNEEQINAFGDFNVNMSKAANQNNQIKLQVEKMANQRKNTTIAEEQAEKRERAEYTKKKEAANQRIDGKKEALNQYSTLKNLINTLFDEQ